MYPCSSVYLEVWSVAVAGGEEVLLYVRVFFEENAFLEGCRKHFLFDSFLGKGGSRILGWRDGPFALQANSTKYLLSICTIFKDTIQKRSLIIC